MNDLIQRIAYAIIRQEGMPTSNNNPGNLRNAPWLPNPVIVNGYWKPDRRIIGTAGLLHIVALRIAEGKSLAQLITSFAPPTDKNPTSQYILNVKAWANIQDENVALWNYL